MSPTEPPRRAPLEWRLRWCCPPVLTRIIHHRVTEFTEKTRLASTCGDPNASSVTASAAAKGIDEGARFYASTNNYKMDGLIEMVDSRDSVAGNPWQLKAAGETLSGKVESTGSWDTYRRAPVGEISLKAGKQQVVMSPVVKPQGAMIDLKSIRLTPVK